ncbi:MAG: formylglycine-generating enzyme family protein, partial [Methylococcales bacterium]
MNSNTLFIPSIAWEEIPGGPFIYQDGQKVDLPAFRIAKYPVTNCQYQTFIDAGGYQEERWWKDLVKPEPEASEWPQPNRPKTHVNWYEAVAFCSAGSFRWLLAHGANRFGLAATAWSHGQHVLFVFRASRSRRGVRDGTAD